ncbi:MAG: polysaccharide biosynthesis tyrosine autokinase, partial [Leptolyngbyaceae cyanobacterium SM1_3_5]|nr:polysaccharide biosynthesis tyrosine autokinase [Leptolyngbyaceae cyanobacterium SM1_3_5]
QLVEGAQPGEKVSPSPVRNLALGLVAGLFLGGLAAFIREAMDRVVRSPDLLNQQTGTPLLGILPELAIDSQSSYRPFRRSEISLIEAAQWMPFREALDLIYKNIQLQSPTLKSLVITSALPQEGKTTFAFGLALSAARLHQRVLLIDADLRRPTLHDRLQIPNDPGLTVALEGAPPRPQKLAISGTSIDVLPAGRKPVDPVKLLSSRRMRDLMTQFGNQYDLVLVDTPPVIGIVDAIEVASCCQGAVLVGRLDRITQTELAQATAALRQLNVLGIVANGSRRYPKPYLEAIDHNGHNGHNGQVSGASIPPSRR